MEAKYFLDHVDIVTTHKCNNLCQNCIDKFVRSSDKEVSLESVEKFFKLIRNYTSRELEVLLLGGEPTMLDTNKLIGISNLAKQYDFSLIMSTNGKLKNKIISLLPYFDWIQITIYNDKEIDFWRKYKDKINIKLPGDELLTMDKFNRFIETTEEFKRRSILMYFTPNFNELCKDRKIWEFLRALNWTQNGSYMYSFYKGVRIKKCIHNITNILDEPTIPKLYPNGNYNKNWQNENLDDYLSNNEWVKI